MFQNHNVAFDWFIASFRGEVDHIDYKNHRRHLCLYLKDGRRFYVLFKHEFIHSFNYLAKKLIEEYPALSGHGESINVEYLMFAKNNKFQIIYIYENEKVYEINPLVIYKISVVREQQKQNNYIEDSLHVIKQEKEYIFPVKLLIPRN